MILGSIIIKRIAFFTTFSLFLVPFQKIMFFI